MCLCMSVSGSLFFRMKLVVVLGALWLACLDRLCVWATIEVRYSTFPHKLDNILFASDDVVFGQCMDNLFRSADGGRSFAPLTDSQNRRVQVQSYYISSADPRYIFVHTKEAVNFITDDMGATWSSSDSRFLPSASVG